jgi:hypothetical protein
MGCSRVGVGVVGGQDRWTARFEEVCGGGGRVGWFWVTGDKRRRTGRMVIDVIVQGYNSEVGDSGRRPGGTADGVGFWKTGDKRWRMGQAVIDIVIQGYVVALLVGQDSGKWGTRGTGRGGQ